MNHGGTQNFTDIKLDRMQQHPSVQAIRIGRTKPYDCSYPVMAERPKIPEMEQFGCGGMLTDIIDVVKAGGINDNPN